jgi:hypothetical protein
MKGFAYDTHLIGSPVDGYVCECILRRLTNQHGSHKRTYALQKNKENSIIFSFQERYIYLLCIFCLGLRRI